MISNGWAGGRVAVALLVAIPLLANDIPLFPTPLHFVRRVEDPIANSTTEVDEYCTGNKIITIRGAKTAIVDYVRVLRRGPGQPERPERKRRGRYARDLVERILGNGDVARPENGMACAGSQC